MEMHILEVAGKIKRAVYLRGARIPAPSEVRTAATVVLFIEFGKLRAG
jgi:hypothetical protein